jgi:hypothetical protein
VIKHGVNEAWNRILEVLQLWSSLLTAVTSVHFGKRVELMSQYGRVSYVRFTVGNGIVECV